MKSQIYLKNKRASFCYLCLHLLNLFCALNFNVCIRAPSTGQYWVLQDDKLKCNYTIDIYCIA